MTRRTFQTVAALLTTALVAAGCGEDDYARRGGASTDLPEVYEAEVNAQKSELPWAAAGDLRPVGLLPTLELPVEAQASGRFDDGVHAERAVQVGGEGVRGEFVDDRLGEGDVHTFSAADWGDVCYDSRDINNPACQLQDRFAAFFPDGIQIGADRFVKLSSASAVEAALPGRKAWTSPTGDLEDPSNEALSRLEGEVVALHLNIAFNRSAQLGATDFGALRIVGGPFEGWAIESVASLAQDVVGGHDWLLSGLEVSAGMLADELAMLNAAGIDGVPARYIRR